MPTTTVDARAATEAAVAGLQPPALWNFFAQLTQIPRPSKHETRVLQYLKDFADARQLSWRQDAVGNLVICRPGSGGGETAPGVVIQGHIDMVCEKDPALAHDFLADPLRLRREGDWLQATGTTLGADNGIGVAAALALLDLPPSAKLPPLECLFTVDEETGLTGAFQVSPDLVRGRTMLNLDTEDWGEVFIGCAGGGDTTLVLEVALQPPPASPPMSAYELTVGGLLGGHSGLNIAEGRGNAVQLLARALAAVERAAAAAPVEGGAAGVSGAGTAAGAAAEPGWRLVDASGGDKRNAIARDARAVILVSDARREAVAAAVCELQQQLAAEYGRLEGGLAVRLRRRGGSAEEPLAAQGQQGQGLQQQVVAPADVDRLLALLRGLPHGPLKFSHAVPGLVETSNNLASLKDGATLPPGEPGAGGPAHPASARRYVVTCTTRSSLTPALEATRDVIAGLARLAGCVALHRKPAYPGWQPDPTSPVLQMTLDAYKELTGSDAKVSAIHAGLECGILQQRFAGMDCVSFGPTIKGAHSPDERVQLSTVEPFWDLTLRLLQRLADVRQ
ncbi:hypothetical protein HYH02_013011 [Chlamydomonas schloesseri]|uniref:Peptidase M20 dimerisation domain-containing protein n=1 Tax=Chlamydomonas schloesseri TaxID=2026947 RepID=A0A835SYD6_9CHLO|nr:hypothetical protein HYH02_013011 [Chlamydomonas schloesseri]|eukprot:KAG2432288.1 hypothetical protein HYH02_013011 [Chlamydomonas schloesseri]